MLFNSLQFLIFFPVVTALFFLVSQRTKIGLLLVASFYFYMAFIPQYVLILVVLILVDYAAGIFIEGASGHKRKLFLVSSIVANIGMLGFFKYYNFFNENIRLLAESLGLHYSVGALSIILPIGLSFHTFQSMSYTIEVYYGRQKAEKNIFIYALYVMFYPQLVAGPIERPQNLLHQFREAKEFNSGRVVDGLSLMLWGFFKKVVIADRLALIANPSFNHPGQHSSAELWLAAYAFTFQIYCDFSGYSDIAIGAARVMGFKLMQNFNRPYLAISVGDFWRRWHISLSTWFRDYVYIPLGGNRTGSSFKRYRNLLIVFLLSGLWHGANWTFVVWGALHGMILVLMSMIGEIKVPKIVKWFCTFHFVVLAWIFFRAPNVQSAAEFIKGLFSGLSNFDVAIFSRPEVVTAFCLVLLLELAQIYKLYDSKEALAVRGGRVQRWSLYYTTLALIGLFGQFNLQQFIYFQF